MKDWFKGNILFHANLSDIKKAFINHDNHFQLAVMTMPGMTKADIEESGSDFITIRTNEGLMKRTNIMKTFKDDQILVEFEELYDGGKVVKVTSHYSFEFIEIEDSINLTIKIQLINTKGFLGFIYKKLSSRSIGNATLKVYQKIFEKI